MKIDVRVLSYGDVSRRMYPKISGLDHSKY